MTAAKKNHGGSRPGSGRPVSGKVKLTVHILPETRAQLGAKPGEAIDRAFSEPNTTTMASDGLPSVPGAAPVYSATPEVAAIALLDGAYDIIETWGAESPSQKAWKIAWLSKAQELGANPSW